MNVASVLNQRRIWGTSGRVAHASAGGLIFLRGSTCYGACNGIHALGGGRQKIVSVIRWLSDLPCGVLTWSKCRRLLIQVPRTAQDLQGADGLCGCGPADHLPGELHAENFQWHKLQPLLQSNGAHADELSGSACLLTALHARAMLF